MLCCLRVRIPLKLSLTPLVPMRTISAIRQAINLVDAVGYTLGTRTSHEVEIIAAEAAGEVAFNIAARTTTGEAFFTGYWGTINRRQSFVLPLRISPSYPASGTSPTLVCYFHRKNLWLLFYSADQIERHKQRLPHQHLRP